MNTENITYSLRNLNNRKSRSLLTIFSILIGIATIFVFVAFGLGLNQFVQEVTSESSADKIIVQAKGFGQPGADDTFVLTEKDERAVRQASGVYDTSPLNFEAAETKHKDQVRFVNLVAYDPEKEWVLDLFNIDIAEGRDLRKGDRRKVVLGHSYTQPDKIFEEPLELNDKITIDDLEYTVVGFFEEVGSPPDDAQAYITIDQYQDTQEEEEPSFTWIMGRVDITNLNLVIEDVEKRVRNSRNLDEGDEDFFVQSYNDLVSSFTNVFSIIIFFVILIALISIVVSAINTANTMITSVLERYKEIGVLKAIGATNKSIFSIFLFESAFLGGVAGVLGVGLGWGITTGAAQAIQAFGFGFLQPLHPPALFIGSVVFAMLTGAISGIIPAIRASKIKPVDALRYE